MTQIKLPPIKSGRFTGAAGAIASSISTDIFGRMAGINTDDVNAERVYDPESGEYIVQYTNSTAMQVADGLAQVMGVIAADAVGGDLRTGEQTAKNAFSHNFEYALQKTAAAEELGRPIELKDFERYEGFNADDVELGHYSQEELQLMERFYALRDYDQQNTQAELGATSQDGGSEDPRYTQLNWDQIIAEGWRDPRAMYTALDNSMRNGDISFVETEAGGYFANGYLLPTENYRETVEIISKLGDDVLAGEQVADALGMIGFSRILLGATKETLSTGFEQVKAFFRGDSSGVRRLGVPEDIPSTSNTYNSSKFANQAEADEVLKQYEIAKNTDSEIVLGRLPDTEAGSQLGMTRLDSGNWTENVNDAFVQGGIDAGKPFYLGSRPDISNYRSAWNALEGNRGSHPQTVFLREMKQLRDAGYRLEGDYMLPPN